MTSYTDGQVETLTRAKIKAKIDELNVRQRELRAQAYAACKANKPGNPEVPDHVKRATDYARQLLNGAGSILPKIDGAGALDIETQLLGVNISLDALNQKHIQLAAIEAAQKAVKLSPAFRSLLKERFLVATRFEAIEKNLQEFIEQAGDAGPNLPMAYLAAPLKIDFPGSWMSLRDGIDAALEGGLFTKREMDRSTRAEG